MLLLKAAAPIQAPRIAGERRDDREAFRGVVDREPDHEERPERERPARVRRTDRKSLAEVVQAHPDGDEQGKVGTGRPGGARPAAACSHVGVERCQPKVGDGRTDEDQLRAPKRLRTAAADLDALEHGVNAQKREQADGDRHEHTHEPGTGPPDERQPHHADRHRDDADVEAEKRHQREERDVELRCLGGDLDGGLDEAARLGQQADRVRLPLDPRVVDAEGPRLEASQLAGPVEGEVGLVHGELGDRHGIRAVVADGHRDLARP